MYSPSHVARLEMQLRHDEAIARARDVRMLRAARPKNRQPAKARPIRQAVQRWRTV